MTLLLRHLLTDVAAFRINHARPIFLLRLPSKNLLDSAIPADLAQSCDLFVACHGTSPKICSINYRACRHPPMRPVTTVRYPRVASGGLHARAHIICRKSGNLPGRRQLSTRPRRPRGILVVRVVNEFAGTWHRVRRPPPPRLLVLPRHDCIYTVGKRKP